MRLNGARFHPTRSQIETIAELQIARLPPASIAERLGIDLANFKAWTDRLAAHRDFVEPVESSEEIVRKLREARREPARAAAEQVFKP